MAGVSLLCTGEKATKVHLGHSAVHVSVSEWWRAVQRGEKSSCLALFSGPVLPRPVPRDQSSPPPLYDFPNMLKSVSTLCVVTGCLYRGLEAISYLARDRAF